ncbi:MAG: heme o synthase [Candidatus Omnitrophica bacterium]|nr:heme o synthase [Candidatus Omnitrophota bacterium]
MKATASSVLGRPVFDKAWPGILSELVKARLTSLVLLSTSAGFYMGATGPLDFVLLINCLAGTGLLAGGAAALNQYWDQDADARMQRTSHRPLPSNHLQPELALLIGVLGTGLGLLGLGWGVNAAACWLGAITWAVYLLIYTPLKRVTPLNTVVGAIPGALPPLIGWTAARGFLSSEGWTLFAVQFLWQVPHFLAIAWLYRKDYARAGFVMLPAVDPTGRRTSCCAEWFALSLVPVGLVPFWLGQAGWVYAIGSLGCGLWLWGRAWKFARERTEFYARRLFYGSLLYLPAVWLLMIWDKVGW